uniref:RING-type domain-containing protein n=1 Tax=Biomphalaria glabrata TaxID=6526 RepID=A0A2C9JZL4_BIOGL
MASSEESKCAEDSTATLLFCRLCQAVYRQPKILPCLHSFCRPCLVSAVSHTAGRGTVIVCPVCSNEAKLPANGIVGVPDNCFLNRLCQEYVSEVQTHLVARSLHSGQEPSAKLSEFSSLRTRLSDELSHPKFSPSTSPNRSASSRPSSVSSSSEDPTDSGAAGDVFSDRGSVTSKGTSASALEAIRNMSRIQTKIMNLQGEALRVTYAIDHVNQSMIDWHQNREDLRKAVQRRAAQYQFFIKRLEHQLITQIDSKAADDTFYAESDKSKSELRKNLKNILYEVSVLKSIQERGKDEEINTLSASILGKSVGMNEVSMKKLHYEMNVPTRSIEEIVNESFGKINLLSESTSVFSPEIIDFTDIAVGSTSEEEATQEQTKVNIDERLEMFTEEDVEEENRRSKRRSNEKRSRRHNTDLGLNSTEVQDYLAQFQTARETFRNRRREILLQGQMAREDASPVRNEVRPRPRSSSRNGRVQSLDRSAMPITRGRSSLPGLQTTRANVATVLETGSTAVYTASMRPTDISLPSPVIEEASIPSSPVRSLVKQISDPRHYRPDISSPSSDIAAPILENQVLGEGGTHSSRRHSSDQLSPLLSPLMQQGRNSVDLLDRTSRPIRRALSAAGDRKSKMEFLRENWQRRKELLIQNEGFVSPESQQMKAAVVIKSPPISPVLTHTATRTQSFSLQPKPKEASALSPPASPDDVKLGPMQQLRSRLSHFRQIIGTNGGAKIKSEEEKSPEAILKPTVPVLSQEARSPVTTTSTATDAVSPVIRTSLSNVSNIRGQTKDSQESSAATPSSSIQTSAVSSQDITPETVSSKVLSAPVTSAESSPTIVTTTQPPSATTTTTTTTGYVSRYGIRSPSTVSSTTTTSSYTSRYSSYSKPATDSFDVAAMIAAMYSGNEKAIISTKKSEPTSTATTSSTTATSSTTSTTNVSTSNSAPSSTATSVVTTTASDVPTTTSVQFGHLIFFYRR